MVKRVAFAALPAPVWLACPVPPKIVGVGSRAERLAIGAGKIGSLTR